MPSVYRSVRVIVQNSTSELFTVEGFDLLSGTWKTGLTPTQGQVLDMQSTAHWQSESLVIPSGTQAYVRMGCTKGYLTIEWNQPWVGELVTHITFQSGPDVFKVNQIFNREQPAFPVVLVIINPRNSCEVHSHSN